ncbi:MAG: hypothetical protein WKF97_02905 [Chitinophagaceae bacterium]
MDANSLRTHRFKAQLNKFSGIISRQFPKTKRRLIKEMVYGIQASKDVKLSNISRSLQEDIPLIKTEDRLSRNLADEDFTDVLNEEILRLGDDKITTDMVIAIDPGDIMKPYAKAMEHLCGIYDGSAHQKAKGYHLCQVTAANLEHNKIVPLYSQAFSSQEGGYVSIAEKMKDIIGKVKNRIGTVGTWAVDRQGDDINLFNFFDTEKLSFVTRLKLNRWLYTHNKNGGIVPVKAERLHKHMSMNHRAQITKIDDGKETIINLEFGITKVTVYDKPEKWYYAVVALKAFGALCMYNGKFYYDDLKLENETGEGKWTNIFTADFENDTNALKKGIRSGTSGVDTNEHTNYKAGIVRGQKAQGSQCLMIEGANVPNYGMNKEVGKFADVNGIKCIMKFMEKALL